MTIEIELKVKVDSFEQIAEKLQQIGADFDDDYRQTDYYFDDDDDSLVDSDRCLRLRRQHDHGDETFELTYKGKRQNNRFKSRREIGIKLDKAEEIMEVFTLLGYSERLMFEKKRQIWRTDGCDIALDELPLIGKFVEIEGPDDESIAATQKKLGMGHLKHIEHSYAHLLEEKLNQLDKKDRKIFF